MSASRCSAHVDLKAVPHIRTAPPGPKLRALCDRHDLLLMRDEVLTRMARLKSEHRIVGDVRAKGCLMGIELVKDKATNEPFDEAIGETARELGYG